MMIEWSDHSEEDQLRLLEYLKSLKTPSRAVPPSGPPQSGCCWRLIGRLYCACLRWRSRRQRL